MPTWQSVREIFSSKNYFTHVNFSMYFHKRLENLRTNNAAILLHNIDQKKWISRLNEAKEFSLY